MEDIIVQYISKHGSHGMFDGIENTEDKPYEWAGSRFENYSKIPKHKKGKVANALQGLLATYKVTKKRLDEVEAERGLLKEENNSLLSRLNDGAAHIENLQITETLLKMENVQLQKEMGILKANNNLLKSTVEVLSGELDKVIHRVSQFSNCTSDISSSNAGNEECWKKHSDSWDSQCQYSGVNVKYPIAPIHSTIVRNGASGEEVMSHTIKCLTPSELEVVVKSVGKFEPGRQDPVEFLSSLETCVNIYRLTDFDACVVLSLCLPSTLSRALTDKVKNRMGNNQDRKKALLEVLGIASVNPEKLAEVSMRQGEHPAAFADRLLEAFTTYSGYPDIMTEDINYKFALINKSDPQTRSAIEMFVTHLSGFDEIIAKMTQFYNNQATSKKSHPIAAIGSRLSQQNRRQRGPESSSSSNWQHRGNSFRRSNPVGVIICYTCGEDGHIARHCPGSGGRYEYFVCYACGEEGHIARHCQDRGGRHQGIVCHSCGKEGHIARNCEDNRSEKQNSVCFSCGKRGHKARRCNSPKTKRKSYQVLLQKIHSLQTQLTLPQDKRPKEETINTWPDKSLLGENDCSSDTSSQYIGIPNDVDSSTH